MSNSNHLLINIMRNYLTIKEYKQVTHERTTSQVDGNYLTIKEYKLRSRIPFRSFWSNKKLSNY